MVLFNLYLDDLDFEEKRWEVKMDPLSMPKFAKKILSLKEIIRQEKCKQINFMYLIMWVKSIILILEKEWKSSNLSLYLISTKGFKKV